MASKKVQAFLERTKALGRPQAEASFAQDFPPEVPVKVESEARDRSPTFSSKQVSAPAETQKAPLMSIKERVALVMPREARKASPRFSTPPKASMTSPKGKPPRASERKASAGRSLSVPKRQSSPARPTPEIAFDRDKLPDIERLLSAVITSRSALQAKLQEQFEKEKELVDLVKASAKRSGDRKGAVENPEQMAKIEEAYKEKTQKMLAVVKEEVMVMDRKLADLMQENTRLKELVVTSMQANKRKEGEDKGESRSSSRSGFSDKPKLMSASEVLLDSMESQLKPTQESEYIDRNDVQIKHIFSNLEQTSSTEAYRELCIHLAKKMIFERRHRLRTETQAKDMMDQQEKTIANLKDKISQYDGRSSAMLSLRESPREEVHVFQDS